ncbi:hypothetical protein [Flagellimonas sp. 2504JD1-5]
MENCINCNCIEEVVAHQKANNNFIERIVNFLSNFTIEGAEDISKIK